MAWLTQISDRVNRLVEYAGFVIVAGMTVLTLIQVFFRYIVENSLSWSEEIALYLFIWSVMLGASIGVKRRFHVAVSFIHDRLPAGLRQVLDLVLLLLIGYFALVMVTEGYDVATRFVSQLSPATRIPMGYVYASVPVSGALILLHVVTHVMETLTGRKGVTP